ncbi:MAG: KEOPS complex N(6)-L-threonylcarbamoyladenine synthase Kae1 [archaeon]|nr:KEOPS complex N(6)-L-threonylcarbamoyladenine synthase Kae1 [archaeon]
MILGVECTAHTFGIGIVEKGKVLVNVRDMYKTESGGIIPMESAKHHHEVSERIYKEALDKAGISEKQITAIALSNAPGLAPCLIAGMQFAKKKAKELGIKIIPVNHCIAHLEIGRSVGAKDSVMLYASGANTQIIAFASGKYRVFGETLDIGIGNFIDKFARHIGLGFPGGPVIEQKAKTGKYIELPYAIKGMDVSFSGMQTKLNQLYTKGEKIEDLSFSLQETAFAMLVEAAERAMAHTGKKELVLGGGVGCNARLQEMCRIMCEERGAKFFCPVREFLVDNAAMIAFTGELMIKEAVDVDKVDIRPRERTDDVEISWR